MNFKNIFFGILTLVVAMWGCDEKTYDYVMPEGEKEPILLSPDGALTYTLIEGNNKGAFETFYWEAANLGEGIEASYQLQFDNTEGDFSTPVELTETANLYMNTTVEQMNQVFRDLNVESGMPAGVQVRVKATGGSETVFSNPVTLVVTRYIYEDEIIVWGINGTSAGDEEFIPLVYNEDNDVWSATLLLEAGEFVFKDKSYRQTILGTNENEGELVINGSAITTENSVYSISLDVTDLTYTIEKSSFPNNLYLVGYHNGWNENTASENLNFFNGTYEVYQNFPEGLDGYECKWIPQLGAWDGDLGDDPANTGNIIDDGEQNVNVGGPGFYFIQANLASMTWQVKKTTWGIIGSATPQSWDAQTNFTDFDPETNTLTMTVSLTAGEMKFRGTEDWSVNYGGSGLSGEPLFDGSNIVIEQAGDYVVTLVLGHGGNYSYSLVMQ